MKMWRLWGFSAVLFIGMACGDNGGIKLGPAVEQPKECGPDQELVDGTCKDKQEVVTQQCTKDDDCEGDAWIKCEGGFCKDTAQCRVDDNRNCNAGQICVSSTNSAAAGTVGTCQSETIGKVCSVDTHCIPGQVCVADVCSYGERDKDGKVVPALSGFQLVFNSAPVSVGGWVGSGAATLNVRARGPGADEKLNVKTALGALDTGSECTQNAACSENDCTWSCTLPAGWAGKDTSKNAEVRVSIATGAEKVLTYRLSLPNIVAIEAPTFAVLGQELKVCIKATVANPSTTVTEITPAFEITHDDDTSIPAWNSLSWTKGSLSNGQQCWTTILGSALPTGVTLNDLLKLVVVADATDSIGSVGEDVMLEQPLVLTGGVACAVAGNTTNVTAPLAFANNRWLAFGAGNNTLRLFDTKATCDAAALSSLNTGAAVQGPMVAMGDTLALALGGRLSVVDMTTQGLVLNRDCAPAKTGGSFDKGLALVGSSTAWQLAAPENTTGNAVLMAYSPSEADAADRCIGSAAIGAPIALTPAYNNKPGAVIAHGSNLSAWNFDGQDWTKNDTWTVGGVSTAGLLGIALNGADSIWLSASAAPRLQLWQNGEDTPKSLIPESTQNVNPVAIDSQGRAYAMRRHAAGSGSEYSLHRLSAAGVLEASFTFDAGTGNTAGSPILGQPHSGNAADTEVYVVSTGTDDGGSGKVFAFKANDLSKELWKIDLGFRVASNAQPVLVPHAHGGGTLWLVGTGGQIRGIRVASNGLSSTAKWAKAFRDNCNTSNALVNNNNMSSCF